MSDLFDPTPLTEAEQQHAKILAMQVRIDELTLINHMQHTGALECLDENKRLEAENKRYRRMLLAMTRRDDWLTAGYDVTEYDTFIAQEFEAKS